MSKPNLDTSPITRFTGHYRFLSNFYMKPLKLNEVVYQSAEHAFQAHKPLIKADFVRVCHANTPAQAKSIARSVPKRPDWELVKVDIMKEVLRAKFAPFFLGKPNPLLKFLLETGTREIIEGNSWGDTYWGQCPLGNGHNMLGKLLMKVRLEYAGHYDYKGSL